MTDLRKTMAENVRRLRKERGLTQEQLSYDAGYQGNYISMIERAERTVSIERLGRIAEALKVAPSDLIEESTAQYGADREMLREELIDHLIRLDEPKLTLAIALIETVKKVELFSPNPLPKQEPTFVRPYPKK